MMTYPTIFLKCITFFVNHKMYGSDDVIQSTVLLQRDVNESKKLAEE